MTCLRLAATFGSADALAPLREPGALTVLRGIEANDLELATGVLKRVLPDQGWTITRPSVSQDTVTKSAAERFQRDLIKLLDVMTPALILQPLDVAVPAHLRLPGVTVFNFAPISANLLLADLTNLYAGGWSPMLLRYHGPIPSICDAQSDRDTQIEDDPI